MFFIGTQCTYLAYLLADSDQ